VTATSVPGPAAGRVERPDNVPDASLLLRDSSGTVLLRGGGTKQAWAGRVPPPDLLLETSGLNQLLEHNPADMTAAVQAGLPLADLQRRLGESGQWLALDPPTEGDGATVGGLLATGQSGPRRLRYGALRDLVIGVTLVLTDGTVAHAGGHVIKNVAGYDLAKLVYGSQGSLALIAEIVLRLHPLPETSATLVAGATVQQAAAAGRRLLATPLEPSAIEWLGTGLGEGRCDRAGRMAVAFEGSSAGVAVQMADCSAILAEVGLEPAEVADRVDGPDGVWADAAQMRRAGPERSVALAGTLPGDLAAVTAALASAAASAGAQADLASHTALGLHSARLDGPADAQARCLQQWRGAVLGLGGTVLLQDRPEEMDAALEQLGSDALGPPPSALSLMRAVKRRFDPQARLAPGRFGEWW
jgi:glycolate oxidase FAD binding subunit